MRRIAVVASNVGKRGGVRTVVEFICEVLERSGRYQPEILSLAASARDSASVRLLAPATWFRGVRVTSGVLGERSYRHIGTSLSEFEFRRYWPRPALTATLNSYDLIQVVSGTPAWAYVVRDVERPVALQVATLIKVQREALLKRKRNPFVRGLYRASTELTALIERKALQHVDACFVENNWMYEELSARIPSSRLVFAPPGVDTKLFRPLEAEESRQETRPYILSVGRFASPRKNVGLLFKAYAQLRQTLPGAPRLMLAGRNAPLPEDISVAKELGITEHVQIRTDVSLEDLARLYRNASLFVLSSDEEGLGVVLLEAMASGVPVVSTDCGGPATMVYEGETGFLTPVGDASGLAAKMGLILRDDALHLRLGKAGHKLAISKFSLETAGNAFLEVYDALLDGKHERRSETSR